MATLSAPLLRNGRVFLPVLLTLYALAVAAYFFVCIVDPYDLRSWGVRVKLANHAYPLGVVPRLFSVAAKDGTDIVMIGASTAMGYTSAMLQTAFPGTRPVNLSYPVAREDEYQTAFTVLRQSTTLKRVIISLDHSFAVNPTWWSRRMNQKYYQLPWYDPVPEFSMESLRLSASVLNDAVVDLPEWYVNGDVLEDRHLRTQMTQSRETMAKVIRKVENSRKWITSSPLIPCNDMSAFREVLLPFVREMSARGVAVDLLIPPVSLASYSTLSDLDDKFLLSRKKGYYFALTMSIAECALETTSGIPNARVHAFNTEYEITADLSKYHDTSHLSDYETYKLIVERIAKGDAVLTRNRWPEFEASLRKAVNELQVGPKGSGL